MLRLSEYLQDIALLDDFPFFHYGYLVANPLNHRHLMGDDQNSDLVFLIDFAKQVEN
ncbi:hypothetical protein D3C73_1662530 [compost metagenome]